LSDHGSGPRAVANPEIDITDVYAFPSPERGGTLVAVMNVFPFAPPSALFSDAIDYRIRFRPARAVSSGPQSGFAVGDEERAFSFTFSVPHGDHLVQEGTCHAPWGGVSFRVGDERGVQADGLRVFAGARRDPFFIDQTFTGGIRLNRRLPAEVRGADFLANQNVLSIVVELDPSGMFGADAGPLVAVLAETATNGSFRARLDRVGRPEIKNFIMMDKASDAVNRDLDVRDLYSEEDGFKLRPDYLGAYRARLNGSLATYDGLDGKTDWPLGDQGEHPLTELLLTDFLVIDPSKPFDEDGYLEIERTTLRGTTHQTCGGRSLNHDIVDSLLTFLINNGNGPRISDGVDQAPMPASHTFPYLSPPNPAPPPPPALVGIPD
jgi:hypothetical protein